PIGEQMPAIQVVEQARHILAAGERDRLGLRERRRNRGQHQRALILGFGAVEDFAGEILEDRVLAFAKRLVDRRAAAAQVLAQQDQCRHPAIALLPDALQVLAVELLLAEYRLGFLGGAAQLRGVDVRDLEARRQSRELRRRIGARHDDKRDAFWNLLKSRRESGPSLGFDPHLLEIVEDDDAGIRQRRKEVAEETPREAGQVLLRLGRE